MVEHSVEHLGLALNRCLSALPMQFLSRKSSRLHALIGRLRYQHILKPDGVSNLVTMARAAREIDPARTNLVAWTVSDRINPQPIGAGRRKDAPFPRAKSIDWQGILLSQLRCGAGP